jgi:hypothetical protein
MCHGMEFGWIRSRCWLGKGVGCLERGWTVSGMELWVGEPDRRDQVREKPFGALAVVLISDCQIQRHVHDRHPGSRGFLDLY